MIQLVQNPKEQAKYSYKFWLMMSIFYAMFLARNVFEISFPTILYLGWVGVMAIFFSEEELKALVISFIPLHPAFQFKYAIFICIVIFILKFYKQIKISWVLFPSIFLLVWELLHVGVWESSFVNFARGFAEFLCVIVFVSVVPKKQTDLTQLARVLALSSCVAFSILLFTTMQERDINLFEFLSLGARLGTVQEAEEIGLQFTYNANGLGFICNVGIVALLLNFYHRRGTFVDALMIAFLVFIGAMTISRTFILLLAISVVFFILLQNVSLFKRLRSIFFIFVAAAMVLVLIYIFFPEIIVNYAYRFGEEDVTNGRSFLFEFYNEFIASSIERLICGIGIQDIAAKVLMLERVSVLVPHNGYQEIVVAWGVVGFIAIALCMFGIIIQADRKKERTDFMHYLPLLVLLLNILAGQFFTASFKVLSLLYIYEAIASQGRTNEKINKK